ncbi:MAG: hypothetical protein ACXWA3_18255 [Acidimicrobiales bacterium]
MKPERVYAGYLGLQAVLGCVQWLTFALSPTVRGWFELMPEKHAVVDAFVVADIGVVVLGSALSAWGIWTGKRWAVPIVMLTTGGIVYATLYLVGWVSFTGTGSVLLWMMLVVSTLTSWCAYQVWRLAR